MKFTFLNLPSHSSRFTLLIPVKEILVATLSQHDGHVCSASVVRVMSFTYGITMHVSGYLS